jgi:hypothetical protein
MARLLGRERDRQYWYSYATADGGAPITIGDHGFIDLTLIDPVVALWFEGL